MDLSIHGLKIAVLCGGPGAEREVSLSSGAEVARALRKAGVKAALRDVSGAADEFLALDCDLAFLALHGEFGEDGTVQRLLDQVGIAYTGSGAAAAAATIDKDITKRALRAAGLPTADWACLERGDDAAGAMRGAGLELPVVVKPVSRGSSVGTTVVKRAERLPGAISAAFEFDDRVMIESFVRGRELTVGMLDGAALPVIELRTGHEFYDYNAKYVAPDTQYLCPAPLDDFTAAGVRRLAQASCETLGVEHMGRVDIMLGHDGAAQILEINTIPGFTSHSLLPKAAAATGLEFPGLCVRLLELAWKRHEAAGRRGAAGEA